MEKTFKQELKEFKETKFNLTKINVAEEIGCAIDYYGFADLSDDEFELVCSLVYDWYTGSDFNDLTMIVRCILSALQDEQFTFEDIVKNPSLVDSALTRYFVAEED